MIFDNLFQLMAEKKASDIFITAGTPIHIKIQGHTMPINQQVMDPLMIQRMLHEAITPAQQAVLERDRELNLSFGRRDLGNFRVNVRDWPGENGDIVEVLSPDDAVPARAHVKVFDGRSDWTATDGGFISESALRFGGADCDDLPVVDVPAGTAPFVLTNDADEDGNPDTVLVLRAPDSGETSDDDICIEYKYHNPHGGGGTICLPFDITGTAVVCIDGHCIVVEGDGATHEPEFHFAAGVVLPPVDDEGIAASRLIVAFPGSGETQGNVYHGPFDPDICIEHSVANPWGGVSTMCISADVGGGDVYCQDGHCVSVLD